MTYNHRYILRDLVRIFFGLCLLLSLVLVSETCARPQIVSNGNSVQPLSIKEWLEDLHFAVTELEAQHKSLFHTMAPAEFAEFVRKFETDLPQMSEDQIIVRFAQLGALVQDGHSGLLVGASFDSGPATHIPVSFVEFSDGIYVRAAAPEYADAVGGRVVGLGSHTVEEATKLIDSVIPHDPGSHGTWLAWRARLYWNYPLLLHGLGLSSSRDSAEYVIEKNDKRRTFQMRASVPAGKWWRPSSNVVPTTWADARPQSVSVPVSIQHAGDPYWFTYLEAHHAVYFQFNGVMNGDGESLGEFAVRLAAFIEQSKAERLIIDVRNNPGGDNTILRPLLVALIRTKLNRRGAMYVIVGPKTFSAAQNFVNRLENYAEPIFLGEPTGNNVNFYADGSEIELPHSHLTMFASHLWWQDKEPFDSRTALFPEVAVTSQFQDYVEGKDPVLQMALTMATPATMVESLEAALPRGLGATLECYDSYVNNPEHKYQQDPERRINTFGYKLLSAKRTKEALLIFEANARRHPESAKAFDSLGEAYAKANEKEHAVEAYRRSLQLNPKNVDAANALKELEGSH